MGRSTCTKPRKESVGVSVLICVKNVEKYIADCLYSILNQTYTDFEIVVVEEFDSNDKTKNIIMNFEDPRIRYFKNEKWLGISKSRNVTVKYAAGEYIFFTDGDCVVSQDWIKEGLKFLQRSDCVGVEGKSYNVSKEYEPTFSDHTYELRPREFMTNNMAYKKCIVDLVGGFDERYNFHEDRDLGLRILRFGKIKYNPHMNVFIQHQTLTPKDLIKRTDALKNKAILFKKFGESSCLMWRIVDPVSLAKILFPPLFFAGLISKKFKKTEDFRLVPFKYVNLVFSRLKLWNKSAKERVLLI